MTAGVFFDAEACEQHIAQNRHHHNKPHSYGIGAWPNPEMVAVQQHLISLTGKDVPSHYR